MTGVPAADAPVAAETDQVFDAESSVSETY